MGVLLDTREVENAEIKRIILYPNQKRKVEQELPIVDGLTDEEKQIVIDEYVKNNSEYEYYTKMNVTYELKDTNNSKLGFKNIEHEINVSLEEDTIDTIKDAIYVELKPKVKEDILTLSNVDIDEVKIVEEVKEIIK